MSIERTVEAARYRSAVAERFPDVHITWDGEPGTASRFRGPQPDWADDVWWSSSEKTLREMELMEETACSPSHEK